ncbi:hypothetical protein MRX96_012514 [Rhipicephalus microplus]
MSIAAALREEGAPLRDVGPCNVRAASLLFCCSAGTFFFFFPCLPLTAGTSTTKPWKHPSEEVVVCSGILYIRHAHTALAECGPFRSNNRTRLRRTLSASRRCASRSA